MEPGPNIILQPPNCKKPVKIESALSGNTFGAVWWTDGKCNAPMLVVHPRLMKSPAEGVFFWLDECQEIGEEDYYSEEANTAWLEVEFAEEPTEEELFALVESDQASGLDRQHYLRTQLWWAGNDHIRWGEASSLSENHPKNLGLLLDLMDVMGSKEDWIRAEILRELGYFEESLMLLQRSKGRKYAEWRHLIQELAEKKDPLVAVVQSGSLSFERGAHCPKEKKKRQRRRNS
jgi:hypothetical protein